jgi:hypothetical protein
MRRWIRSRRFTRGHWQLRIGPLVIAWVTRRAAAELEPDIRMALLAREKLDGL